MKKLKIAIIGVGNISRHHIAGYQANENCEIYAFCDINEDRLKYMGKQYNVTKLYTDRDQMFAECPEIDAVSVCTWNCAHAECTIAALNAGKHVICEKPMAMNEQEANAMKEAAEKNNKLLMIGFVRRYGNDCAVVKDFVDAGDFGDIYYAKTTYLRRAGSPGGWFGNKALSGGGPLIDLGVHVIDLARYVAGNPKPVSVYGATFKKLGSRKELKGKTGYVSSTVTDKDIFDVEDMVTALIRFDNGLVLSVEASFSLNIKKDVGTIELFGTKAGATLSPELEIFTDRNGYLTNVSFDCPTALSFDGLFKTEINHFVDCIIDGIPCKSPAEDGVIIMKILDAIYKSAETGHEVEI
jgi:predicted dehydrogenase